MKPKDARVIPEKAWYTINELINLSIEGLDGSKATIHRKAVKQKWIKRQREGVKGVAYEYHVSSLPAATQAALGIPTNQALHSPVLAKMQSSEGVFKELISMLTSLTLEEQEELTHVLKRKGVETLLYLLDDDNVALLQLDHVLKEKILGRQPKTHSEAVLNHEKARECGLDGKNEAGEEILTSYSKRAV